jgi:hypothetical protein
MKWNFRKQHSGRHNSYVYCSGAELGPPLSVKEKTCSFVHIIQPMSYSRNTNNKDKIELLGVVSREEARSINSAVALPVLRGNGKGIAVP